MSGYLKIAGALLLLASLGLPLSSCRVVSAPAPQDPPRASDPPPDAVEVIWGDDHAYALDGCELSRPECWGISAGFTWPVLALGVTAWSRRRCVRGAIRVLEPILLMASLSLLVSFDPFLMGLQVGFFVAVSGLALYALGALGAGISSLRAWWRRRAQP